MSTSELFYHHSCHAQSYPKGCGWVWTPPQKLICSFNSTLGQGHCPHVLSEAVQCSASQTDQGWRVCKAVAGQGLQCRCILWDESSHYAALSAHVCLTPVVLISSCPVSPWLIHQCQLWWMCLWGRVLVPGSCWVFKIQVGQKFIPSFTDLSGANSAGMMSGSCGKQNNFSPEFISQVQHGPVNINQVNRCFSRSFSSLCSLLDISFWLFTSQ